MPCSSSAPPSPLRPLRLRRAALTVAGLALVVLTGCQVDITVGVDARRDGSGEVRATVTLDEAAAKRVPDLASQLQVEDLRDAGWTVTGPDKAEGGGVVVVARKPFRDPAGASEAVRELSGDGGPFQNFRVTSSRSFFKTTTTFSGDVDLTAGLAGFSDADLQARLGGEPLGVDQQELERQVGSVLEKAFKVRVAVRLPGDVKANTVGQAGNGAVWSPGLGEKAGLEARAEDWNTANLAAAAVALIAGIAFAVLTAYRLRARPH